MKKINKKKKGFTLIELVIVLAVLAIIALIAIPNFTKVRNDSLQKADDQTIEQIRKITLMAIANGDIEVPTDDVGAQEYVIKDGLETTGFTSDGEMLKEVKKPQVNGVKSFKVKVLSNADVKVETSAQ